jgi:hypothetical protein
MTVQNHVANLIPQVFADDGQEHENENQSLLEELFAVERNKSRKRMRRLGECKGIRAFNQESSSDIDGGLDLDSCEASPTFSPGKVTLPTDTYLSEKGPIQPTNRR